MHMRIANPSYANSIYATFQKVLKIQLLQISWGSLVICEFELSEFYLCDYEFNLWNYILILFPRVSTFHFIKNQNWHTAYLSMIS